MGVPPPRNCHLKSEMLIQLPFSNIDRRISSNLLMDSSCVSFYCAKAPKYKFFGLDATQVSLLYCFVLYCIVLYCTKIHIIIPSWKFTEILQLIACVLNRLLTTYFCMTCWPWPLLHVQYLYESSVPYIWLCRKSVKIENNWHCLHLFMTSDMHPPKEQLHHHLLCWLQHPRIWKKKKRKN